MTYSLDFRRKVMSIKEREGLGREETARRFGIGVATLDRWAKRLEPKATRDKPATKIDREALARDVEQPPDAYQRERAARLGASQRGVCAALKRLGISRKKNAVAPEGRRGGEAGVPGADGGA
jgi:transposase